MVSQRKIKHQRREMANTREMLLGYFVLNMVGVLAMTPPLYLCHLVALTLACDPVCREPREREILIETPYWILMSYNLRHPFVLKKKISPVL